MGGTIKKKDGIGFKPDEFFDFLEANNYEYSGGYKDYKRDEMIKTIEYVASQITEEVLKRMMVQCKELYGQESTIETLKETLLHNGGTGSFSSLFTYSMSEETNSHIHKYSNSNWEISDEFDVDLGEAVVKKIDEILATK